MNKTRKRYIFYILEHAVSRGGRSKMPGDFPGPSAPTGMTTSLEKREHEAVPPSTEQKVPSKA